MIKSVTIQIDVDVVCDVMQDYDEDNRVGQSLNIRQVLIGNTDITAALEKAKFDFGVIEDEILTEL